ncbi:procathepsin L-like isoform X3 [Haliotis rubra]|uniref:procathepsin L-like isoform X1 n=1 Tax=Haliotis rubra TaxID=36100 RepID=UPI001EE51C5E|nr:procathepsin L-like isoform X1 [Haliotis rubra]XP_046550356.1 procathepsin L-like isoform X1 [Haliotis rubra]XP_046550357.1 procathepsin L-like isoform X2 [Haliotis rubra]XP_046550358.1 procathepsin L-like isoform X1 [Haliotis rubra]XP_046550359.1 procathepsin L-like isoform X3 [Haliotis rubra]
MQYLLLVSMYLSCVMGHFLLVEKFNMSSPGRQVSTAARTSFSVYEEWQIFKNTHGKIFRDFETEKQRYETFKDNLLYIADHNKLYKNGAISFYLGINQFADMTHGEFRSYMHLDHSMQRTSHGAPVHVSLADDLLPHQIDWRTRGYVTPVKDQGQCGSCWAFSTTGSLEGQHFRKKGRLISLSEQQLVDCSRTFSESGCNGGWVDYAFNYIAEYGIELENAYPYLAHDSMCKYEGSKVVANCTGHVDIGKGSESDLKSAVGSVGPVSVAIDASHRSFQLYKGGVYSEKRCSRTNLDHAVLAAGYGTLQGLDYWLVKNSWGLSWGEGGYVKMTRNKHNQCGIASEASYPRV